MAGTRRRFAGHANKMILYPQPIDWLAFFGRERENAPAITRAHLARIQVPENDPRDVWLEFYPSPDPRLDNMKPLTSAS